MNETEDIKQFLSVLYNEDELGSVIRGHILIESLLIQIVEQLIPEEKHLKKLNLDYDDTVTLAMCLGVKEDAAPSLRSIGSLRNNFAHNPDTALTKEICNNLYSSLSKEQKDLLQKQFSKLRSETDELKNYSSFKSLKIRDQFLLIAITIWTSLKTTVVSLNEKEA